MQLKKINKDCFQTGFSNTLLVSKQIVPPPNPHYWLLESVGDASGWSKCSKQMTFFFKRTSTYTVRKICKNRMCILAP